MAASGRTDYSTLKAANVRTAAESGRSPEIAIQISVCSDISSASSTSTPKYLTVSRLNFAVTRQ